MREEPRRRKAQHDAACHAGVHHLNAQNGGLARARKAGHPVRLGKQSQRFQRGVVGCEEHKVGHQRQQGGILLFGFGAHGSHPHAENDAEVVDEHHHPVVEQLPHQLQWSPLQHRQRLTQGLAGEQRPQHQQQARRRKIRQRRQQRL